MLNEQASTLIVQITEKMSPQAVDELAFELNEISDQATYLTTNSTSRSLSKIAERITNSDARYLAGKLFEIWKNDNQNNQSATLRELASALKILAFSQNNIKKPEKLELVWTGPVSKIPVRQTRQVLTQIIGGAQKELLIVSFVVLKITEIL